MLWDKHPESSSRPLWTTLEDELRNLKLKNTQIDGKIETMLMNEKLIFHQRINPAPNDQFTTVFFPSYVRKDKVKEKRVRKVGEIRARKQDKISSKDFV